MADINSRAFIIYSNQHYCVWDSQTVRNLRVLHRISGSFVGCTPGASFQVNKSGLPFVLTRFEARLLVEENLASLYTLKLKTKVDNQRELSYEKHLQEVYSEANREYREARKEQILKNTGDVDEKKLSDLKMDKMKVPIDYLPNQRYSNYELVEMTKDELKYSSLSREDDDALYRVFKDLWSKHLFVSSGLKFGCDFLAYQGDPLVYHSTYAVRVVKDKIIDLDNRGDYDQSEMQFYVNSFQRLCYNTHKTPLFAFVADHNEVIYKTVNQKDTLDIGIEPSDILRQYLIPLRPVDSSSTL